LAASFNEYFWGEQPYTFFFLDEKEPKNQASSYGGSHGATHPAVSPTAKIIHWMIS
jgi:hypothetical protein